MSGTCIAFAYSTSQLWGWQFEAKLWRGATSGKAEEAFDGTMPLRMGVEAGSLDPLLD